MQDSRIRFYWTFRVPPQILEESNIWHLNVRVHDQPTISRRLSDRLLHKFKTKARASVRLKNRKPIPLPLLVSSVKGIQADRSHGQPIYDTNEVGRAQFTISTVLVRVCKDSLLNNEYVASYVKMLTSALAIINSHNSGDVSLASAGVGQELPFRKDCRSVICKGVIEFLRGSSEASPEHAWQRAHPAFAVVASIPRMDMYACTRR